MSINNLESNVFQDKLDFKTFESILELLGNVTPKKIPRKDFNNLRGDFLTETGEDKFGKKYDLFLPDDLKVFELPAIISRVNKMTFGEILPDYASKEELKVKIAITLNLLINTLANKSLKKNEKEKIKKYIKDICLINDFKKLNNNDIRNDIIKKSKLSIWSGKFRNYEKNLEIINSIKNIDEIISEMEETLVSNIHEHFNKCFFENGINILRSGMLTITQNEQKEKIKYCEENGYKKDISQDGKIIYNKEDSIVGIKNTTRDLDKKQRLLREKIGIDKVKKELEISRILGDKKLTDKIEKKIVSKILRILYEYSYILDNNGYSIKQIYKNKEIICVGYTLLGHAFLSELGIKHYGVNYINHTALIVNIGEDNYIFDAANYNVLINNKKIKEFYNIENIIINYIEKTGLSNIYNGIGNSLSDSKKYDEAIKMYNLAIQLNPNDYLIYNNKGVALDELGKYEEAIEVFDIAIKLKPNYYLTYNSKGNTLNNLGKYEEAIEMFNIAIKLKPNYYLAYNNKGNALGSLQKYKKAIEMYNLAIYRNVNYYLAYINKGFVLCKLKKYEEAIEIYNLAIQLNPNDTLILNDKGIILYKLEKYEEGIETYNKAIKLNPNNHIFYNNKGFGLNKLGKYKEAINEYNITIKLNPKYYNAYNNKGKNLYKLLKIKSSKLYKYTGNLIEGKDNLYKKIYLKEKAKIKELISSQNFEGLRQYLLQIEKEEK